MKLKKPLIILDLETTGLWIEKDKIVEIGMIKCQVDGSRENYVKRINPGIAIPKAVSNIIGITNEDVKDCPYFKDIAANIIEFIGDSDIAGYGIERFDLPILEHEFTDAGLYFVRGDRSIYDAQKIFHCNEKRDLTAAYKFYCRKNISNAHSSLGDASATLEVLTMQINKYGDGDDQVECLKKFDYVPSLEYFDQGRKFRWWNHNLYPTFGKYAGKYSIGELLNIDKGYLNWILAQEFTDEVKIMIQEVLNGKFSTPPDL